MIDEAVEADGRPRPHYAGVLRSLDDPTALAEDVAAATARLGVRHGVGERNHTYHFDPVPRILSREDWALLRDGLAQRTRALEAFVADAHGPREAVRAGIVPADAIDTSLYLEPEARQDGPWIGVAGPDVVRGADGRLVVLEDNVRTPTMMAYAAVIRDLLRERLPGAPGSFGDELRAWMPRMLGAPPARAAILTEGARNALAWEIEALGRLLALEVVEPRDLRVRGGRLLHGDAPVEVLWRRTSEERLRDDAGRPNELGELLLEPLRAGTVRVVNAFGTGVADDKRVYPYVDRLVRFFCGEEPVLRSVPAYDLGDPAQRAEALPRLGELVLKPRSGSGGYGVLIGPRASADQVAAARAAVEADPGGFIAQEPVAISTHPTVLDGRLQPRHLDLRPFVVQTRDEVRVLAGGLSRVALRAGDLVVNSSQGGGGKDTWVPA